MAARERLTSVHDDHAVLRRDYPGLDEALRRDAAAADVAGRLSDDVLAHLRSSGILAAAVPAAYGGLGAGAATTNDLIRQVAAADPSVAIILFQHYAVTARISEWATEEQKQRFLPPLATGEWIAASAWSESGAGADKRNLSTTADRTATGWSLNGAKTFTTGAGLAQLYLVLAQTSAPGGDDGVYGSDGQTFFLIEADRPGLIADTGMDLVGMRASATGFVELHGCRVPLDNVLGPVGQAARIIAGVRQSGATLGAVSVGIAEAALELALTHARRRGLDGAQAVRHRLADLAAQVESARALVERAGRRESSDPGTTTLLSKLHASRTGEQVCLEAQRLLGSAGYLRDHPLNRLARDARAVGLMGPTNDLTRELVSMPWTA
ncbi:acyl-CoA dehydrogenase family protein [Streptomyces lavenduligriseus]|uniref:Acyl-CoA dehydrogenase family protein n=1 Tax=Streptomyces lavenduligriseus TaxID=67315 RepID=A0ABT0NLI5_9ACTN|nr:acyl-CoA dehydrogenase family protein [Streptomyces lavenduligriseus]MCL3992226.1 acyl-CoA dehydrogenase family protein [Streptomyces lavenduligriseus]